VAATSASDIFPAGGYLTDRMAALHGSLDLGDAPGGGTSQWPASGPGQARGPG
jgi:hypothetical protein